MDEVDDEAGVLLTAQGLLMYLGPEQARGLVARCAARFRGGVLVFDAVPAWLAQRSRRGRMGTPTGYRPPPWTWGLDRAEEQRLRRMLRVAELRPLRLPRGRGFVHGWLLPGASAVPALRRRLLSVLSARLV
jgi:hypothetical protein